VVDPLAEVVMLLQPAPSVAKSVTGSGRWRIRRTFAGQSFYCAILEGACRLAVAGHAPTTLEEGDFLLIPATFDFTATSLVPPKGKRSFEFVVRPDGEVRHGDPDGPADVRMLVGECTFGSPDASMLVSLLPRFVHVRGEPRLATLLQLVKDENRAQRPARDVILARLLEVLFIEALRGAAGSEASAGLVRGLADERLAVAIRKMHERPTQAWTVAQLAKQAGLSRSTFFDRFNRAVGVAPMEYLLGWRMALAKDLLRRKGLTVGEVAQRVGYRSGSTFSVAFTRHVGMPPARFARALSTGSP
jgi:AraC-like DNA-binding protein